MTRWATIRTQTTTQRTTEQAPVPRAICFCSCYLPVLSAAMPMLSADAMPMLCQCYANAMPMLPMPTLSMPLMLHHLQYLMRVSVRLRLHADHDGGGTGAPRRRRPPTNECL